MQRSLEQRYSIKFCVKLNKTSTETIGLLKEAYGDQSLSSAQVKRWHKSFKEGREDVEDEQRSGRPSTTQTDEDVNRVREFLNIDRRASLREISEELNLTYYNVREIVTGKLEMRKVCAKLVPKVLTDEQKQLRVEKSREVLESDEQDNTLDNCITGDETWCFEYDPEGKRERECGVAHEPVATTQEGAHVEIQGQNHADHLFRLSRHRPQGVCTSRKHCKRGILQRSAPSAEKPRRPGSARPRQQLDPSSRQCAGAHRLPLHLCIGQDGGSGASPPSLQPRPVPSGLLLVPAPEKKAEGEAFRLHRGDPKNCDSRIERDSGG